MGGNPGESQGNPEGIPRERNGRGILRESRGNPKGNPKGGESVTEITSQVAVLKGEFEIHRGIQWEAIGGESRAAFGGIPRESQGNPKGGEWERNPELLLGESQGESQGHREWEENPELPPPKMTGEWEGNPELRNPKN